MSANFANNSRALASATDVALSNPLNNQTLTYDATVQKWRNRSASGAPALATYVAAPTGVASTDTAAITAAITAAGAGGALIFATGTYSADQVVPLTGQTWIGSQTTIQRPASSTNAMIVGSDLTNFVLRDFIIDGNRANASATSNSAVFITRATRCRFMNILFQNMPYSNGALELRGAVSNVITECAFFTVGYAVLIMLLNGTVTDSVSGNSITACAVDTTDMDASFFTENAGSTSGQTVVGRIMGTEVSGCTFRNVGDTAIESGSGCVGTQISGCTIIGNANGNNGIIIRDTAGISIVGCDIRNYPKTGAVGIYLFNLNGNNADVHIANCVIQNTYYGIGAGTSTTAQTNISISGCTISTTLQEGIGLSYVAGLTIIGNTIRAAGGHGIALGQFGVTGTGCSDGVISGNRSYNSGQAAAGQKSGIIIFQASKQLMISTNHCYDTQTTKTQQYGIRVQEGLAQAITICDNDLQSNLTGSLVVAGATGIRIKDNVGYNPIGVFTIAVAASPFTYTAGQSPEVVYVDGGAVSSIVKGGITVRTSTGCQLTLAPSETITVTYTATPTMTADKR